MPLSERLPQRGRHGRQRGARDRLRLPADLTAHVRARRFMDAGAELLAAVTIIAGGVFAYGFLPIV
ncbi:hypothetical protein [Methylobacterium sp. WL8]|uniref:hypothetical protein n=1 Tax=Methylobacterium sp. WL8 TaxID=2603899 RepID=UPI00164F5F16|nr:hypothetical protein [Methylobacterium sp. WL8]